MRLLFFSLTGIQASGSVPDTLQYQKGGKTVEKNISNFGCDYSSPQLRLCRTGIRNHFSGHTMAVE